MHTIPSRFIILVALLVQPLLCISALAQLPYRVAEQFPWEDLSNLTRGHRLHILYGLQLSGWCDPEGAGKHNGIWNASRWAESHLTTPSWNVGYAPDFLGAAPGSANWGLWGASIFDTARYLDEQDYLDTLVLLQYGDETALDDAVEFADAAETLEAYREALPQTINFIDLHGSQVLNFGLLTTLLQQFLSEGRPDMVVMNDYLFNATTEYVKGGTPYALWTSMAVLRASCLAGYSGNGADPIPAGQFLQTATHPIGLNSHVITESELNVYIFSSLAFGFKTLIAYRYGDSASTSYGGIDTVLFSSPGYDSPTPAFYYFADAIAQARNLGPALVRLQSTDIRVVRGFYDNAGTKTVIPLSTSQTPEWTAAADPFMKAVSTVNLGTENNGYEGSVLLGYFEPLDETFDGPAYRDQEYFMVVNSLTSATAGEAATRQRVTIDFDFASSGITQLLRVSRATGALETVPLQHLGGSQYRLVMELDGGMGDLFKYDTGAPFAGMDGPWTDADGDSLPDAFESDTGTFAGAYDTGTSSADADSDNDGLLDGEEVNVHGTNPLLYDTDGDFASDAYEIEIGTNPADPNDGPPVPVGAPIATALLMVMIALLIARVSVGQEKFRRAP